MRSFLKEQVLRPNFKNKNVLLKDLVFSKMFQKKWVGAKRWSLFSEKNLGQWLHMIWTDNGLTLTKRQKFWSLPNSKHLQTTKSKKFVLGNVENIVGKGENAVFNTLFSKAFFSRGVKSRDSVVIG